MFKKITTVHFEGKPEDLILLHSKTDLPKKTQIEIPQGYHVILMSMGGGIELIKDVYRYELTERIMYIYYVRDHIGVQKNTWGTRTRMNVKSLSGESYTLGGYGFIEWQLNNAIKFIERRWANRYFVQIEDVARDILDYIPLVLSETISDVEKFDISDPDKYKNILKEKMMNKLKNQLKEFGIEVHQLVIENFNFQRVVGEE
jgi:membrane protease subunit (stomatin/prohibitin family)